MDAECHRKARLSLWCWLDGDREKRMGEQLSPQAMRGHATSYWQWSWWWSDDLFMEMISMCCRRYIGVLSYRGPSAGVWCNQGGRLWPGDRRVPWTSSRSVCRSAPVCPCGGDPPLLPSSGGHTQTCRHIFACVTHINRSRRRHSHTKMKKDHKPNPKILSSSQILWANILYITWSLVSDFHKAYNTQYKQR